MDKLKELIEQRDELLKENKRLQAEFRKTRADFNKLLRKIKADLDRSQDAIRATDRTPFWFPDK